MKPCSGSRILRLAMTTALALSFCGAAEARPSPERLAAALAAVIWDGAPPPDATERLRAGIVAEYPLLDAAIARGEPDYVDATLSAALLAREASHPATRRAMYDIARSLLAHAVEDAGTNPMLAEWRAKDPVQEPLGLGTGLAVSDFAATAFLLGLEDPPGADPSPRMAEALTRLTSAWSEQAESPSRRFILTRLDAWTVGILANRAALSPEQRAEAANMPWSGATPSPETTKLVTGVPDFIGWFAGISLALTPEERAAHPELVAMAEQGQLAGAMGELVARAPAGTWPMLDHDSYLMMFRMNNHMIGGGDMGDWRAGPAMWGLQ